MSHFIGIFIKMQVKPINTRFTAPGTAGALGVVGAQPMPFK